MVQSGSGSQSQKSDTGRGVSDVQVADLADTWNGRPGSGQTTVPGSTVTGEQYLIFSLLDREFAIQASHIQGVERLAEVTPIPNVASWIWGVINLRGSICSVVDLRAFLDMERLPYNPRTRLLSVKYNEMLICLVVDGVSDMVPILPQSIDHSLHNVPQWALAYTFGLASMGSRRVILLDATRLLFADKMHHYSA